MPELVQQEVLHKIDEEKKDARPTAAVQGATEDRIKSLQEAHARLVQELDSCKQELLECRGREEALRAERDAWEQCRYKPLERLLDEQRKACGLLRDANVALVQRFADEEVRRGETESKLWERDRELEAVRALCENKKKEADNMRVRRHMAEREARMFKVP